MIETKKSYKVVSLSHTYGIEQLFKQAIS